MKQLNSDFDALTEAQRITDSFKVKHVAMESDNDYAFVLPHEVDGYKIAGYREIEGVTVTRKALERALRALRLLSECPPTVRRIINAGDSAIEASGLNPWCMNEGAADGSESHLPWWISDVTEEIQKALSV